MPVMRPVESSAIEAVGYEPATRELFIRYVETATYVYRNVGPEVFDKLISAPSKGAFVNEHVKPRFDYEHLD